MSVQERLLVPQWAPELVALSYCISWLGAYTSTQIIIHAKYTSNLWVKWLLTFLASLAFGFCAVWCMHFVGMLACRMDIRIGFDLTLTILSALVAVAFTFAALSSAYITESIDQSQLAHVVTAMYRAIPRCLSSCCPERDPEAGYEALPQGEEERRLRISHEAEDGADETEQEYDLSEDDEREASLERVSNALGSSTALAEVPQVSVSPVPHVQLAAPSRGRLRGASISRRMLGAEHGRSTTLKSPSIARQRSLPLARQPVVPPAAAEQDSPSMLSSSLSSSDLSSRQRRGSGSSMSGAMLGSASSGGSLSWDESLHIGLSREAQMPFRARARERPLLTFGWRYWTRAHWKTITTLVVARAAVWGMALVLMHYCGMWAMEIPRGRISWDLRVVVLSYLVAFTVCLITCITMEHMEVHFGRQIAFSTITALGCCSMHYTGMAAATFYTYEPPAPPGQADYPIMLPVTIIGVAISVCVASNVVLAHSAIIARNRMTDMILTKRRLWRIMAEKEAAEQASELKQEFISVASHEIRTPLHTVNGYCELLARTELTEEQTLYVTSIQQACHAINVIAGNVLDFGKLDRNNVELPAQPVLMQLRKVVEDLARIQPGQPDVDIVVSVASDVPKTVYLDETYILRVLMNLLSNAQKFCDEGYICIALSMIDPGQLMIQVRDTGCGIPASFLGVIFEPFRQANTFLTRTRQGTGLGLSIVKHLVQRMNGTVDVESVEGEGTTFTVKLPVVMSSHEHPPLAEDIPLVDLSVEPAPNPARMRLRIVYSDKRTEALFVELWAQQGYVTSAGLPESSVEDVVRNADSVWADVESIAFSGLLRALLCVRTSRPFPVYIVYTQSLDLAVLEPELSDGRNVILVKRPVILHALRELIDHPEAHMGVHLSKEPKVHVAVTAENQGAATSAMQKEKEKFREKRPSPLEGLDEGELVAEPKEKEKEKVLLVEDNLINRRLGQRLLEKLGYDVVTANDGQEAIDAVTKRPFFCCLMDCQMPVVDGFMATKTIRQMEEQDSEERCRAAGMDHFLSKPLVVAALDETLKMYGRTTRHG